MSLPTVGSDNATASESAADAPGLNKILSRARFAKQLFRAEPTSETNAVRKHVVETHHKR
jgi:hypothetical protein